LLPAPSLPLLEEKNLSNGVYFENHALVREPNPIHNALSLSENTG